MQDPQLGVWHSIDPMTEKSSNHSPFEYVNSNPTRLIDPTGMTTIDVGYSAKDYGMPQETWVGQPANSPNYVMVGQELIVTNGDASGEQ
jgi:hypothetical protein